MRKSFSLLLAVLFCLTLVPAGASRAEAFDLGQLHCRYAILVDAANPSAALYGIEKNADEQCPTGSTIKILTTIVTLENGNPDDLVTISKNATDFSAKNSLMGIYEGEQWTLRDLLYGLMLPSGNDAAVAIAEHIAGSTKEFAKLMNEKAAEIGMKNTHVVTVNGRDDKNHYSTARDMAVLTAYALKNPEFCKIVGTAHYSCTNAAGNHTIDLTNTDRLIADQTDPDFTPQSCLYPGAIGVKTGDTNNAGKCFIGAASRGGITLIGVGLGGTLDDEYYQKNWLNMKPKAKEPYNVQRFTDVIAMFDYAFTDMSVMLTMQDLIDLGMPTSFDVQIENFAPDDENSGRIRLTADVKGETSIQLMKPYYEELKTRIRESAHTNISNNLFAPVTKGDTLGTVTYDIDINGVPLTYNLVADRSVKEGIIATTSAVSGADGAWDVPELISAPIDSTGAEIIPVEEGAPSPIKIILFVVLGLILLAVLVFAALLIRAKIRREKRRKARAARKKREREMMARQNRYRDE